jgi:hypothetical protein
VTENSPSTISHPSAWLAADVVTRTDQWIQVLPTQVRREIESAASAIRRQDLNALIASELEPSQLPLARDFMAGIEREVMEGRGFVLLRGLSPDLDDSMLRACYWLIVNLLGRPISQNSYGDRLCDVTDTGRELGGRRVRGYQTNAELKFHTDRCDLVGLLCLRPAMSGGRSSIASAVTAYNQLVERQPEMMAPLIAGMNYLNIEEGGDSSIRRLPVFHLQDGVLSVRYSRNSYQTAMQHGAPYTDTERAALDAVDAIAADPALRLDMDLMRGDMQLINNYTTLHSRTAFQDWPEAERKRCMVRAWLRTHLRRPVGPHFSDYEGVPVTLSRESPSARS